VAKRSFLAEVNHQIKQAQKRDLQKQRPTERARLAAVSEAARLKDNFEAARQEALNPSHPDRKAGEQKLRLARDQAMQALVVAKNQNLGAAYDEIDSILAASLEVDDFVDLEQLRITVEHPPFCRPDLETPLPPLPPPSTAPEPVYVEPHPLSVLDIMLGKARRHRKQVDQAKARYVAEHQAWQASVAETELVYEKAGRQHEASDRRRLAELEHARNIYAMDCKTREAEAAESNEKLDRLIADLEAGAAPAIEDYVGIVLANSVYPDGFPVEHDFDFDPELRELTLTVWIPGPSQVPTEKEYRYVKTRGEVATSQLAQKAQKDRYTSVVHQVALRSMHEVFESDRMGWIQSISLTVAARTVNPATGLDESVRFVAVAAERESYLRINLSGVVPLATLEFLGAQVSKNPHGLTSIDVSQGVRTR